MAHHLGLAVVAEGIEDAEQRDFLAAHGCDVFQGFFFARPMPLEQLRAYLGQPTVATEDDALPAGRLS